MSTQIFRRDSEGTEERMRKYMVPNGKDPVGMYEPISVVNDGHSKESGCSSGSSVFAEPRPLLIRQGSNASNQYETINLSGGYELKGESLTENAKKGSPQVASRSSSTKSKISEISARSSRSTGSDANKQNGKTPCANDITSDVEIPINGNIQGFSVDNMVTFFRLLKIDEKIVQKLKRRKVDGKKFSKMPEKDLEEFGLKNPVICYFKDKSKSKNKSIPQFML